MRPQRGQWLRAQQSSCWPQRHRAALVTRTADVRRVRTSPPVLGVVGVVGVVVVVGVVGVVVMVVSVVVVVRVTVPTSLASRGRDSRPRVSGTSVPNRRRIAERPGRDLRIPPVRRGRVARSDQSCPESGPGSRGTRDPRPDRRCPSSLNREKKGMSTRDLLEPRLVART
ncbi:hypothetical protein GCM10009815_11240 [Nocardioides marmoribigeumensis]